MATTTTKNASGGKFPEGFVSPFKRVQMEERNDDALACISTLANKTLAEVTKIAVDQGYPPFGPAFVDNSLMTRVLGKLGLAGGEYEEVPSIDALPDVAVLMIDYREDDDMGRHVVWHHVRGTADQKAYSYIIDPASWLEAKHHVTTDWRHLKLTPAWYIGITPKANGKSKA